VVRIEKENGREKEPIRRTACAQKLRRAGEDENQVSKRLGRDGARIEK
jgi:hypothetical protein